MELFNVAQAEGWDVGVGGRSGVHIILVVFILFLMMRIAER